MLIHIQKICTVYAISKGSSGFYSLPVCDALGIWEYKARITCFFPHRGGKTVFAFFIEESSDIFTSFPFNTRTSTCVVQAGNRASCLSLAARNIYFRYVRSISVFSMNLFIMVWNHFHERIGEPSLCAYFRSRVWNRGLAGSDIF